MEFHSHMLILIQFKNKSDKLEVSTHKNDGVPHKVTSAKLKYIRSLLSNLRKTEQLIRTSMQR